MLLLMDDKSGETAFVNKSLAAFVRFLCLFEEEFRKCPPGVTADAKMLVEELLSKLAAIDAAAVHRTDLWAAVVRFMLLEA